VAAHFDVPRPSSAAKPIGSCVATSAVAIFVEIRLVVVVLVVIVYVLVVDVNIHIAVTPRFFFIRKWK
jgi:hypothetical protein